MSYLFRKKMDYLPHIKHKTSFRWIVDLNMKENTIKILEKKGKIISSCPWVMKRFPKQDIKVTI